MRRQDCKREILNLNRITRLAGAVVFALCIGGCAPGVRDPLEAPPRVTDPSPTAISLETLPRAHRKVDIAVYQFADLTGKNEPNDTLAVFSRAVTQGGTAFVVDALRRAGRGNWFTVVERTNLAALLQERQLINATRKEIDGDNAKPLPPLHFAGLLLEGGIIGYDANTITGGIGANYLGIGGDVKYRRDTVTVGMRVVSVQSGQILTSVTTTKTVYSVAVDGNAFKYVAVNKLLQAEAGITKNEPTQLAVRQAIDLAVYATVIEGARVKLWRFADPLLQAGLIERYLRDDKIEVPAAQSSNSVSALARMSSADQH
ncbi:CsgG/HfaB family protein [Rhodopseudomonas sp. B29]|uniref:CsgG/HfaB family protein n=1 Tax=Rhodopseudomonas sp. B29 TaxID=95607 RepID=UPI0003B4A648|nr:CsgG/HfaB family protein [Rhodopseudomonas sp. B29]